MLKKDFTKFYNQHLDKIYRFVFFRVGGRKELAEDLTSEIFIKALEHFNDFDESKSRFAWLYTIAHNHLANHFRDASRRVEISIEEKAEKTEIDVEETIEFLSPELLVDGFKEILRRDAERELWAILSQLTEEKKQLVTFKYLLGYSYKEIAEILGMSEVAAKVAAHRALNELKAKIK